MSNMNNGNLTRRDLGAVAAGLAGGAMAGIRPARALTASTELRRIPADEAVQAVATDKDHFYAIANSAIGKYRKDTGEKVGNWQRERTGPIRHMNSGIMRDGKLYCANSNFPETPMVSSIEIFDPDTMTHIGSHSFGLDIGSATWIEWRDGKQYVMFAHYDESGGMPNMDHRYTQLVEFDDQLRRTAGWTFPPNVLDRFKPESCSGGVFGKDGMIYCTAHHNTELYVMKFPSLGPVLEYVGTIPDTTEGQGIAWDTDEDRVLWGISRRNRDVVAWKIPPLS